MSNVVNFTGVTRLRIPADNVLEGAMDKLKTVTIFGIGKDGRPYTASTEPRASSVLLQLELLKVGLLMYEYDEDEDE